MSAPFGNYQYEIYLRGMAGETPSFPMGWGPLEAAASEAMDPGAHGYVFGGAGTEDRSAKPRRVARRRIVPRMLRNVAERDLSTEVSGRRCPPRCMLPDRRAVDHPSRGRARRGTGRRVAGRSATA